MSNSLTSSAQLLDNFMVTVQIHKVTLVKNLASIYNCKLPVHCLQLYSLPVSLELQEKLGVVQPFISLQAEWKQTTQCTQMLQHEGKKGDAYPYSMLLPVPEMHSMITTKGVPLLPSSFLQLTKLSMRKYRCITNCGALQMMFWLKHNA